MLLEFADRYYYLDKNFIYTFIFIMLLKSISNNKIKIKKELIFFLLMLYFKCYFDCSSVTGNFTCIGVNLGSHIYNL